MNNNSFVKCDSVSHEGQTNTWFTPKYIIDALGPFDLDPCTQTFRPFNTAKTHICEDLQMDGLNTDWFGRVWLNPPYGRKINLWLDKLIQHRNGIALVFSRTDTSWAQRILKESDGVNFLKKRIAFLQANGQPSTNAGVGSMLLAFGKNNLESIQQLDGVVFKNNEL